MDDNIFYENPDSLRTSAPELPPDRRLIPPHKRYPEKATAGYPVPESALERNIQVGIVPVGQLMEGAQGPQLRSPDHPHRPKGCQHQDQQRRRQAQDQLFDRKSRLCFVHCNGSPFDPAVGWNTFRKNNTAY